MTYKNYFRITLLPDANTMREVFVRIERLLQRYVEKNVQREVAWVSKPLRYLALGDSYTIGEELSVEDSWPMQWMQALRAGGINIAEPGIIAKTGWATDELAAAMSEAEACGTLSLPYDLVSLCIGVNNQYRGRDMENYGEEFSAILKRAIGYADEKPARVFVLSIPDWGISEFAKNSGRDVAQIAHELDAYNHINKSVSNDAGVHWIDISAITREAGAEKKFYANDGLHPSKLLYALWVMQLLKMKI